jgi:hypothetical protein
MASHRERLAAGEAGWVPSLRSGSIDVEGTRLCLNNPIRNIDPGERRLLPRQATAASTEPSGPHQGQARVLRGGCWLQKE